MESRELGTVLRVDHSHHVAEGHGVPRVTDLADGHKWPRHGGDLERRLEVAIGTGVGEIEGRLTKIGDRATVTALSQNLPSSPKLCLLDGWHR